MIYLCEAVAEGVRYFGSTVYTQTLGLAKLMAKENYELMGINFTCIKSAKVQTVVAAEVDQD